MIPMSPVELGDISPQDKGRIVGRIAKDFGMDQDQATRLFDETLLFLSMCAQYPGNYFVPSEVLDKKGWHTFLLYTRAYQAFSRSLGLEYIHHEPSDSGDVERGGAQKTVRFMKDNMIRFDTDFWPDKVMANDCTPDPCTCTGCSEWD